MPCPNHLEPERPQGQLARVHFEGTVWLADLELVEVSPKALGLQGLEGQVGADAVLPTGEREGAQVQGTPEIAKPAGQWSSSPEGPRRAAAGAAGTRFFCSLRRHSGLMLMLIFSIKDARVSCVGASLGSLRRGEGPYTGGGSGDKGAD